MLTAVNDTFSKKEEVLPVLKEIIKEIVDEDMQTALKTIDIKIKEMQIKLLEAGNNQKVIDEIGEQIISLREEKNEIMIESAKNVEFQERIEDMFSFLEEQTQAITEYSDALVRRLIGKITIYDNKAVIEFKSGIQSEVEI